MMDIDLKYQLTKISGDLGELVKQINVRIGLEQEDKQKLDDSVVCSGDVWGAGTTRFYVLWATDWVRFVADNEQFGGCTVNEFLECDKRGPMRLLSRIPEDRR